MITQYFLDMAEQFTNPVTAIAQILGFIPMFMSFFVFYFNNRIVSITIKAVADFLSSVHFLLLGQATGCAICGVNALRDVIFAQKGKYKWASGVWMPLIFGVFTVCSSILGWTGPESFLPMIGSCFVVTGYWCQDMSRMRKINFVGIFLWFIYGIATLSVSTIVGNLISLVSIILTEIRVRKHKEATA